MLDLLAQNRQVRPLGGVTYERFGSMLSIGGIPRGRPRRQDKETTQPTHDNFLNRIKTYPTWMDCHPDFRFPKNHRLAI
jgi:hypothetical protein